MEWNEHVHGPITIQIKGRKQVIMPRVFAAKKTYGSKSRYRPTESAKSGTRPYVSRKPSTTTRVSLKSSTAIPRTRARGETKIYNQSLTGNTIDQRLEAGNQQAVMFQPSIGAASNQRIGNRVYLKGVSVCGWLNIRDNMDKLHLCRIALYRLLHTTATPTTAQLNKIVNQGAAATHLGENLINLLRPWNTDYFKIYKSHTCKLGKSAASAAESNNDYEQSFYFKWWIPINDTIYFDDAAVIETNFGMYFGGAACESDGTVAAPQSAIVNYEIDFNFHYTDK